MGKFYGDTAIEVSRDIDLKKLNFQGIFEIFLDFPGGMNIF